MQKVDRLGWAEGIVTRPLGTRIGLRTNAQALLPELRSTLCHGDWTLESGPVCDSLFSLWIAPPSTREGVRNYSILYHGAQRLGRSLDQEEVLGQLSRHWNQVVACSAKELFFVPGSVWRQGQGRLLAIATLARLDACESFDALSQAGMQCVCEDSIFFDRQGRAHCSVLAGQSGPRASRDITLVIPSEQNSSFERLTPGNAAAQIFALGCSRHWSPVDSLELSSQVALQAQVYGCSHLQSNRMQEVVNWFSSLTDLTS